MAEKSETKDKISLIGYDPVQTPEEIIAADKDNDRREAFKEAYKKAMSYAPIFLEQKRKPKPASSSGGKGFSQEIKITPENVKIETKGEASLEEKEEEKGRERED